MPDAASQPTAPASGRRRRPWWQWVLGGLVVLVILSVIFGDSDPEMTAETTTTVTVTQPAQPAATQTTPSQTTATITDAQVAVDADDYPKAVSIAKALGPGEEQAIRRRIANRIARRVSQAVRAGDRGQAKTLLARADRYPTTILTRQATSSYRAATARAAEHARARRVAAEQRRRDERADEQVAPETGGSCDPGYSGCVPPYPPDVNCPQVAGPVQVMGSDPHGLDRDGDGIACES